MFKNAKVGLYARIYAHTEKQSERGIPDDPRNDDYIDETSCKKILCIPTRGFVKSINLIPLEN